MSDALQRLIDAVEGGYWPGDTAQQLGEECHLRAYAAFNGSLDAAKYLHDALLPGWLKNINFIEFADGRAACTMFGPLAEDAGKWEFAPKFESVADCPARAWLLAILRAYQQVQQ